jgi:protein-L-isoaspartate(D-aspartate) O-methyltransferase
MRIVKLVVLTGVALASPFAGQSAAEEPDAFAIEREALVRDHIERPRFGAPAIEDAATLRAMRAVERHKFVAPGMENQAYADRPLPIGHGQTISQPYIVALMTELLDVEADDKVLEIGAGSGYQAAVLAEIVDKVYTIEIIEPLGRQAMERFEELGYGNVETRIGDGYHGWAEHAPFDAIIVTAAASHIPPPLVEQLKPGGRMVIPVGPPLATQQLMVIDKDEDGEVTQRSVMPVRFVPLTRGS